MVVPARAAQADKPLAERVQRAQVDLDVAAELGARGDDPPPRPEDVHAELEERRCGEVVEHDVDAEATGQVVDLLARRIEVEGPLPEFVAMLNTEHIPRVPGTAVFPHPTKLSTPLALRANVAFNHVLHERVVIVSVQSENVPHIPHEQRLSIDELGHDRDGILHLEARFGFQDDQDLPEALRQACGLSAELDIDPDAASYFLSRMTIERGTTPGMSRWRKRLFVGLAHNAASPAADFHLPVERTVIMGSQVEL